MSSGSARLRRSVSLLALVAMTIGVTVVAQPAQAAILPGTNGLVAVSNGGVLFAVDPVTGARSTLLGSASDTEPSVAPNATKVAFVNGGNIFTADFPTGTNRQQITTTGGFSSPSWSPDSTTLVFDNGAVGGGLFKATATPGAAVSAIAGSAITGATSDEPDYNPSGQFIVFDTSATGFIARVNADSSGGFSTLNGAATGDDHPRVSPDGATVVFGCAAGLCTLPFPNGGSRVSPLAGTAAGDAKPTFSPDNTKVAFQRTGLIRTVNANGTGGFASLVGTLATDLTPSWSRTATGTPPPPLPPGGGIAFTAASACGSPAMLSILQTATVAATNTVPGHGVALTAAGLPSYVSFNPATGVLSLSANPLGFLDLLFAIIQNGLNGLFGIFGAPAVFTSPTVVITATDTVAPAASPATCSKQIRVNLF